MKRRRSLPLALAAICGAAGPLYAATVRAMLRHNVARLNAGDVGPLTRSYAADVHFVFPGRSSWATDRRGKRDVERWVQRFADVGLRMKPDEIIVNGPPWNTRVCLRYTDQFTARGDTLIYENRGTIFGYIAWGKLTYYEVHEDTEKVAAFDEYLAAQQFPVEAAPERALEDG